MGYKLEVQKVIEKEFEAKQQVGPKEKLREGEVELCEVPEVLRCLLWEQNLLQGQIVEVWKTARTEQVGARTMQEFVASKAMKMAEFEQQREELHVVFWAELRRRVPKLKGVHGLALREGYKVVKMAEKPEEPEEGDGNNGRGPIAIILGLIGKEG